jgi:hypothetical protein
MRLRTSLPTKALARMPASTLDSGVVAPICCAMR